MGNYFFDTQYVYMNFHDFYGIKLNKKNTITEGMKLTCFFTENSLLTPLQNNKSNKKPTVIIHYVYFVYS